MRREKLRRCGWVERRDGDHGEVFSVSTVFWPYGEGGRLSCVDVGCLSRGIMMPQLWG